MREGYDMRLVLRNVLTDGGDFSPNASKTTTEACHPGEIEFL